jgi:hypothetical protein
MERVSCAFPYMSAASDRTVSFLSTLKEKCLQAPGNPEFWSELKALGRDMSLISNKEARKYGGAASISERRAEEVRMNELLTIQKTLD